MRSRKRPKRRAVGEWPGEAADPDELAALVTYVGSAEHKSYPSPVGDPRLRSDATRCDPDLGYDAALFTEVLREAIRRRCVSSAFNGQFPRYVWGWHENRLFEARLVNREQGQYKAYELEEIEMPRDPDGRLDWSE